MSDYADRTALASELGVSPRQTKPTIQMRVKMSKPENVPPTTSTTTVPEEKSMQDDAKMANGHPRSNDGPMEVCAATEEELSALREIRALVIEIQRATKTRQTRCVDKINWRAAEKELDALREMRALVTEIERATMSRQMKELDEINGQGDVKWPEREPQCETVETESDPFDDLFCQIVDSPDGDLVEYFDEAREVVRAYDKKKKKLEDDLKVAEETMRLASYEFIERHSDLMAYGLWDPDD